MDEFDYKDTSAIQRKIAELRPQHNQLRWEYLVNNKFRVLIFADDIQDHQPAYPNLSPTDYSELDVNVYDLNLKSDLVEATYIYLHKDPRFINYCKYKEFSRCDGRAMSIEAISELIKYLYTLSNLVAFW